MDAEPKAAAARRFGRRLALWVSVKACPGANGAKVGFQTDRADARTAAAVRDTESFVQIHVQHVRADFGRLHDADLGVEVGAVHVNLSAVFVNNAADVTDAFFVHAVGGRIGNHDG